MMRCVGDLTLTRDITKLWYKVDANLNLKKLVFVKREDGELFSVSHSKDPSPQYIQEYNPKRKILTTIQS